MGYVIAVTWVARPGQEPAVEQILRTMVSLTRAEPGCVRYDAHRSLEDPRRFFLYEEYQDEAAATAHSESEHFKHFVLGQAVPRLESRERSYYQPLE